MEAPRWHRGGGRGPIAGGSPRPRGGCGATVVIQGDCSQQRRGRGDRGAGGWVGGAEWQRKAVLRGCRGPHLRDWVRVATGTETWSRGASEVLWGAAYLDAADVGALGGGLGLRGAPGGTRRELREGSTGPRVGRVWEGCGRGSASAECALLPSRAGQVTDVGRVEAAGAALRAAAGSRLAQRQVSFVTGGKRGGGRRRVRVVLGCPGAPCCQRTGGSLAV